MSSKENRIPKQIKPDYARIIDSGGEAASGAAWAVFSHMQGAASSRNFVQLIGLDIVTGYSKQLCGHTSHALNALTQGFSEV